MTLTEENRLKILKVLEKLNHQQYEIIISSHNDLDCVGTMLNINYYMPKTRKKFFHTNYRDLDKFTHDTINYINHNKISALFITDVSFSQYPDLVKQLDETCTREKILCVYIDHHMYPDNFFDGLKMHVLWDTTKSATKLTQLFFGNEGKSKQFDELIRLIDIYDIWQSDKKEFRLSMIFNEFFWYHLTDTFFDKIVYVNNYAIPSDFKNFMNQYIIDYKEAIEKYRARKLIHSDGITTIAFVDSYFNDILYEEFAKGIKIILIVNSYGIVRCRFNSVSDITDETKIKIKQDILGTENIGHLNAFSFKIEKVSFEAIMNRIQEINKIIKHRLI